MSAGEGTTDNVRIIPTSCFRSWPLRCAQRTARKALEADHPNPSLPERQGRVHRQWQNNPNIVLSFMDSSLRSENVSESAPGRSPHSTTPPHRSLTDREGATGNGRIIPSSCFRSWTLHYAQRTSKVGVGVGVGAEASHNVSPPHRSLTAREGSTGSGTGLHAPACPRSWTLRCAQRTVRKALQADHLTPRLHHTAP